MSRITVDFIDSSEIFTMFLLDDEKDATPDGTVTNGSVISIAPNTVCLLKSV